MSISPICNICGKKLKKFGGLIFSPPEGENVKKYHVCETCFKKLEKTLKKN